MGGLLKLLFAIGVSMLFVSPSLAWQPVRPGEARPAPPLAPTPGREAWKARIEAISEDHSSLLVMRDRQSVTLAVSTSDLQTRLRGFRVGDMVRIEAEEKEGQGVLRNISAAGVVSVDRGRRVRVLFFSGLGVLLFGWIVLGRNLPKLLVGEDGRYSNSKFQIVVWFGVLVLTYAATVWLRWWEGGGQYIGGVNLPQNLLILSGVSVFTFAAAKGITTAKIATVRSERGEEAVQQMKPQADRSRFPSDLLCDDRGRPDVGDFQMLVITLLAVAVYALQVFTFLGSLELLKVVTIPDVDTTILATFGLGQGAYLTKKYAGDMSEKPAPKAT